MADTTTQPQPPSTTNPDDDTTTTAATAITHNPPPLLSKLTYLSKIYTTKSFYAPLLWLRDWKEYLYPPPAQPNIVKTYECRPDLPVRIFFPSSYDLTSPHTLPTLFTIHGSVTGAPFCLGDPRDDDEWNRSFADGNDVLVVALNYSKAPGVVFPAGVFDVEALMLAVLGDESLPVDRTSARSGGDKKGRIGVLGFGGAGGNLAMGVTQMEEVRRSGNYPGVVVNWGGWLDLATPGGNKGEEGETWKWGYLPYGVDLRDGLVSPFYAGEGELPEYKMFVGAEGDVLAGENWGMARRLAGKGEASRREEGVVGREEGSTEARLEREDERFWFEEGKVKWLLVPDVGAGFEHREAREEMGWGEETVRYCEEKTEEVMLELGSWLKRVWGVGG